jgi:hypothetical protein
LRSRGFDVVSAISVQAEECARNESVTKGVEVLLRHACSLVVATGCLIAGALLSTAGQAQAASAGPLSDAFADAAEAYDVPRGLLVALAYSETHLDGHNGEPSASGGYGVMHLQSNPVAKSLEKAAEITGKPVKALRADNAANVLGGAAVLRS